MFPVAVDRLLVMFLVVGCWLGLASGGAGQEVAPAAARSGAAGAGTSATAELATGPPLRRIILLSCDTLSAQHMSAYGYDRVIAAAFDSLAERGVLFRNCVVPQVWTLASHMSMLTGLAPGVHRVGKQTRLAESIPTLPEILAAEGLVVAGFPTTNHWLAPTFGFGRGFAEYRFLKPQEKETHELLTGWCRTNIRPGAGPRGPVRPFFLFRHYMDVHTRTAGSPYPYWPILRRHQKRLYQTPDQVPPKVFEPGELNTAHISSKAWDMFAYAPEPLRAGYDACVLSWDQARLRRELWSLKRSGHLRDVLIVVTSDHGEEIGEHGGRLHDSPYGEVREVPLLMIWPGRLPAGAVVDQRVSVMDLAPTILDLAELDPLPHCQGLSLRPLLADPGADFPIRDFLVDGHHRDYALKLSALVARAEDRWWSSARADRSARADAAPGGRAAGSPSGPDRRRRGPRRRSGRRQQEAGVRAVGEGQAGIARSGLLILVANNITLAGFGSRWVHSQQGDRDRVNLPATGNRHRARR